MENLIRRVLKEYATYEDIIDILSGKRNDIETVGIMTAWNPKTTKTNEKENIRSQNKLKRDLRKHGYNFIDMVGQFESTEDSLLIINIPKQHLIHLGSPEKFNQSSVIFGRKVGRKMIYEYLVDGLVVERRNIVLGKDNDIVKMLQDYFSIIKNKRFKIPFFEPDFDYPEKSYEKDLLKSKNIDFDSLETKYIKIIDMMMRKNLSPMKYEKLKKIVDLYFDSKGIDFVNSEYNKLSDMGMSGENLALIFGEYDFF